ncbi:MAG: MYXO-CTERM sorting domain-containing protein, partial [Kofleriaceae bacterium]
CTRECVVEASDSCPTELECRVIDGEKLCAVPEGGGCCSSSDQRVPWVTGLLTAVLGFVMFRRRRTAHA